MFGGVTLGVVLELEVNFARYDLMLAAGCGVRGDFMAADLLKATEVVEHLEFLCDGLVPIRPVG